MEPVRERLRTRTIGAGGTEFVLTLDREDFSALYPHMVRYVLSVVEKNSRVAVFRTNTFEYSPLSPLAAETVARKKADAWERELAGNPANIFRTYADRILPPPHSMPADIVIIQGSPRPDGNCGILAGWITEATQEAGRMHAVIYPHDLDIHCCIGCYQCYNTGSCVFDDDMREIIDTVRDARLIIVCSPVYTNTVPAGLKLVIDRMQAYHAERTIFGGRIGQRGLLYSVAGRKGRDNFTCITKVVKAFYQNCGIELAGELLIDSMDAVGDIRKTPERKEVIRDLVLRNLGN